MDTTLGAFGSQSTLDPAGPNAEAALGLTIGMSIAGVVILVIVMGCVWLAWRARGERRTWWIVAGGIVAPIIALAAFFVVSTGSLRAITADAAEPALVIEVTGHQYWWDVVYDPQGAAIRDANEVVLPVGVPVRLRLLSDDVIHSFWVPSIAGKMDMIPGRVNELTIEASEAGRFRGQCAEFCGLSHPLMAFEVVAVTPEEFVTFPAGLEGEARDAVMPDVVRGREVFLDAGCAACHQIRGVAEGGRLGPDLTRVGDRGSLGASMWRMTEGNLAGWIADVQDMKPGAQMPSYDHLPGEDLRAVAAYLASLE